ncbi:uncharacterized protein LOC62_02G002639 [Vanrija pseudolonga]|uniref:Uncharacterized protein n=1 Tax=Vanrija pseudolonga TaxID=143232 RepID=A0AAF0Y8X4_9TREE|nr:hypothetical protein LOC62_02G002639 [Vanrija pseudolonga]
MPIRIPTLDELEIEGNVGKIAPEKLRWMPSFPADTPDDVLRKELEANGVVHVKGVIPREYVLATRRKYFETVAETGILKPDTDPTDGIFSGENPTNFVGADSAKYVEDNPIAKRHIELVFEAAQSEWAKEFCENEHILAFVHRFKPDWTAPFCFKRQIWRSNIPNSERSTTGVHYDHIFLRGGPPIALTAWVPVGDVHPLQGGLIYLEDSLPVAQRIEDDFTAQGLARGFAPDEALSAFNSNMGVAGMLSRDAGEFQAQYADGRRWMVANYEAGDVVFHHSFSIHASTTNRDPDGVIRLSADLRYADREHPYDGRWDQAPYHANDGL